jgi:hypothetical protein
LVDEPPHPFFQIGCVFAEERILGNPRVAELEVAGNVGAAKLLLEAAVAAVQEAADEEEGLEGDEVVSGFAKAARNLFGEKRNGAGRVGDEEEDLVHVLVVDGAVVMAGGSSESLDYHFPGAVVMAGVVVEGWIFQSLDRSLQFRVR